MRLVLDNSLPALLEGYTWLPARRARTDNGVVHTRVMGQRAVGLCGPDAARFFYDETHVRRHTAIPEPVQSTLFGNGSVHTLDGAAHRSRKDIFLTVVTPGATAALGEAVGATWDRTAESWQPGQPVVLFDEAAHVLTHAVTNWAGVRLTAEETPSLAEDLVAMVDGFATAGPRHWRARRARHRREAWLGALVTDVRAGRVAAPTGSALDVVATRDLSPRLAAVELLNVIRPTVAVCWFVAYAGHALHRWPEHRPRLASGDPAFVAAFVHELRRFYPFAPFIGGRAVTDLTYRNEPVPAGALVLLDLWGHNHDSAVFEAPFTFRPSRFLDHEIDPFELVPQGAGDPTTNHRCPGEPLTVTVLRALVPRLARLAHDVPDQDLTISLHRVPARLKSGFVLTPRPT